MLRLIWNFLSSMIRIPHDRLSWALAFIEFNGALPCRPEPQYGGLAQRPVFRKGNVQFVVLTASRSLPGLDHLREVEPATVLSFQLPLWLCTGVANEVSAAHEITYLSTQHATYACSIPQRCSIRLRRLPPGCPKPSNPSPTSCHSPPCPTTSTRSSSLSASTRPSRQSSHPPSPPMSFQTSIRN